jgi:MT0933-like antitoxin protein
MCGDLEKKAEAYAQEHPEQADKGINEVSGFAERDSDHQHDEQIDRAVDAAEQHIGQDQPGKPELAGGRPPGSARAATLA